MRPVRKSLLLFLCLILLAFSPAFLPVALAETPALSFGAEQLTHGTVILLGQDDFGDSIYWKILDNDGQKALAITRNTIRMNWIYGDGSQFWFIDE